MGFMCFINYLSDIGHVSGDFKKDIDNIKQK